MGTRVRVGASVALLIAAKVAFSPSCTIYPYSDSYIGPKRSSTILFQEYCGFNEY